MEVPFFHRRTNHWHSIGHSLPILMIAIITTLIIASSLPVNGQEKMQKNIQFLKQAAENGDAAAQYELAIELGKGKKTFKSEKDIAFWFEKAAVQNYRNAAYAIGYYYTIGRGVTRNYDKAIEWLERSAATADLQAYCLLSNLYSSGKGVRKDPIIAAIWMRKFNDRWEWKDKERFVGRYGIDLFIPENMLKHLQIEADAGDPYSQFNLGFAIYRGRGTFRDPAKALHWFERSASQNNIAAMVITGMMYELGSGTKRDPVKAVELYDKASKQNDYKAHVRLGHCYEKGEGVNRDLVKAQTIYILADEQVKELIPVWASSYSEVLGKHLSKEQSIAASNAAAEWLKNRAK